MTGKKGVGAGDSGTAGTGAGAKDGDGAGEAAGSEFFYGQSSKTENTF